MSNTTFRAILRDEIFDRLEVLTGDRHQGTTTSRAIEAAIDTLLDEEVVARARELSKK